MSELERVRIIQKLQRTIQESIYELNDLGLFFDNTLILNCSPDIKVYIGSRDIDRLKLKAKKYDEIIQGHLTEGEL